MDKVLYLARHAKSSWSDRSLNDFERPLNKRGRRDAPEMGRRLREREAIPEVMVCSPAERARQTAELLDLGTETTFNERIYEASVEDLLDIICGLPDHFNSAMLIGHNPSMGWLINQLSGQHLEPMPTCSVATLALGVSHWMESGTQQARLLDFDYPKRTADRPGL